MLSPLHGIVGVVMLLTSSHDDGVRQARAHTHGVGEAVISIESEGVFIEIIAPAANFTSAEYGSDFDNLMLENIALFPERAGCTLSSLDVEAEGEDDHSHETDHHHDEDHDHDEHAHDGETHSDYLVTVDIACENTDRIDSVDVRIFETWSGFETLRTTILTENGAGTASLTASSSEIDRP